MRVAVAAAALAPSAAGAALAEVALEPEDEVRLAQDIINERHIPCGRVVGTRNADHSEDDRMDAMG